MSTLTLRQLDPQTHARLRGRAAEHGRSVEAEVRAILDAAVEAPKVNFLQALREEMQDMGGDDLAIEPRTELPRDIDLS
jgi:plasmid stability protein